MQIRTMTQQQHPLIRAVGQPLRLLQPADDHRSATHTTDDDMSFVPPEEPMKIGTNADKLVYVSEAKYQRLLAEVEFVRQMRSAFDKLTASEREILCFISQGMSAKQIGYHRYVAESTVCKHRSNLYKKLGIGKTVEAMWFAQTFDLPLAWPVNLMER
ncbi:MAG: helix-turn-helix transcriptional regulator [Bacteroidota bacterium]